MASHKSAKKRIRSTNRKKVVNTASESKIKTSVKKVLAADNKEEAEKLYKEAIALLDRSTNKGKIHRNTAARKKSALTKHVSKLTAQTK